MVESIQLWTDFFYWMDLVVYRFNICESIQRWIDSEVNRFKYSIKSILHFCFPISSSLILFSSYADSYGSQTSWDPSGQADVPVDAARPTPLQISVRHWVHLVHPLLPDLEDHSWARARKHLNPRSYSIFPDPATRIRVLDPSFDCLQGSKSRLGPRCMR